MSKKLTATRRQTRALKIPEPNRKGNIKVTREGWIECAKVVLIEEGIGAVKVDRLAKRLGVTRGGFYYQFTDRHKLLEALLDTWRRNNRFTPRNIDDSSPAAALRALEATADRLIHENGYDHQFDMAIREWARISQAAADVVKAVDEGRMKELRRIFAGMGCSRKEAMIRARVFYYHQIGYYAMGVEEDTRTRERNLSTYLTVLCGDHYLAAARAIARPAAAQCTNAEPA